MDRADELTRKWTPWASFQALLESNEDPTYFPTLSPPRGRNRAAKVEAADLRELADLYDQAQERRGDPRRAYRGVREEAWLWKNREALESVRRGLAQSAEGQLRQRER